MAAQPLETRLNVTEQRLVEAIENATGLDAIIDPLKAPVEHALEQRAGLRSWLDGTWLGHAVHPAVTDVPVGAWTAGWVLDMLDALGINRNLRQASDTVQVVGLAGALGAAVFGLADWSYTRGRPKRVGFVHGVTNLVIAGLCGGSLLARAKGKRGTGVLLSALGYELLLLSTWLGGELAYRFGVGVNHGAFQSGPADWVDVAAEQELGEGQLRRVEANGVPVLLARYQGQVYAIGDTCTHLGCSLSSGRLQRDMVVCPCHGSGFRITDGRVLQGPASVHERTFAVRAQDGRIAVRQEG